MENMKDLVCNNFNRLVDSSNLKKREIAKLIGVNENTLQRWKNKDSYPELPNIEKLAEVLGVSPLEFYKSNAELRSPSLSVFKKALTSIPDDVFEKAAQVSLSDSAWDTVRDALDLAIERNEKKSKKSNPA